MLAKIKSTKVSFFTILLVRRSPLCIRFYFNCFLFLKGHDIVDPDTLNEIHFFFVFSFIFLQSEFERSLTLYQPLTGTMQNRFTSGGHVEENIQGGLVAQIEAASFLQSEQLPKIKKEPIEKDPVKRAAKRKQFGPLTRIREQWKPDRLLCIRFNVPNPFPE